MTTSLNFLNYETIVTELEKGLRGLHSVAVRKLAMNKATALAEFRTIGFTGARQTGRTDWIQSAIKDPARTLVIFPMRCLADAFEEKWLKVYPGKPMPCIWVGPFYPRDERRGMSPYLDDVEQFDRVYVDEATRYFSSFRHAKTYKALAAVCTDDVVITLVS